MLFFRNELFLLYCAAFQRYSVLHSLSLMHEIYPTLNVIMTAVHKFLNPVYLQSLPMQKSDVSNVVLSQKKNLKKVTIHLAHLLKKTAPMIPNV